MIDRTQTRRVEDEAFKQLSFAVRLFQDVNWAQCREGDRLNIEEELLMFNFPVASILPPEAKEKYKEGIARAMPVVQDKFREYIVPLANGDRRFYFEPDGRHQVIMIAYAKDRFAPFERTVALGGTVITAVARLQDYLIESRITPAQIRRCPECAKVFLLRKKPQRSSTNKEREHHCSPRCATKAATRAYRDREAKKAREKKRKARRA